jgi:hypothetical protein
MANYSAAKVKHQTLSANVVDVVTLTAKFKAVEVLNRGSADIYFRVDGTAPTVAGDDCFVVVASASLQVPSLDESDVVRLIASSSCAYSVTGVTS